MFKLIVIAVALGCVAGTIYKNLANESTTLSASSEKQPATMEYKATQDIGCGNVGTDIHCAL